MARERIERIIDDLTGQEISESEATEAVVKFNGKTYNLETTKKNAERLTTYITEVLTGAKQLPHFANTSGSTRRTTKSKTANDGADATEVRRWAKENNVDVPDRGRVPGPVWDAYNAAH